MDFYSKWRHEFDKRRSVFVFPLPMFVGRLSIEHPMPSMLVGRLSIVHSMPSMLVGRLSIAHFMQSMLVG
jgi:hypothetical protein